MEHIPGQSKALGSVVSVGKKLGKHSRWRTRYRPNNGSVREQSGLRSMAGTDGGVSGRGVRDETRKSGGAPC